MKPPSRAALNGGNEAADAKAAIDSVERGIRAVNAAPRIDPQADQYRTRLLELLTQQKKVLSEFTQATSNNRERLRQEEDAVIDRAEQFVSDYSKWLPGFLKERGYELSESNDR